MPLAKSAAASTIVDRKIYVVDRDAPGALTTVEVYDPLNDTWAEGPALKTARGVHAGAVYDDSIYVFAGNSSISNTEKRRDVLF